jgi:hypothetical protein
VRSVALALAAMFAASPVAAGERDLEVTTELVQAAIDARGSDTYDAALQDVYAYSLDEATKPECRAYADAMLAGLLLMDIGESFPESPVLLTLFGWVIEYAPVARNDCLLAI